MSFTCSILTPINLYYSSPELLAIIQSSWNTQPHMQQKIEAQHMSWGQGCSLTFIVNSLSLQSNSTPLQVTPLLLHMFLTYGLVVTYCIVYHYIKRIILARLLANKGLVIYIVHLNKYFIIPLWYYLVVTFLWYRVNIGYWVLMLTLSLSWLGKTAKSFSIFIFIFLFLFFYLVESLLERWSMGKESYHSHKRCDIGHRMSCHSHSHNMWQGSHMMGNIRTMGSKVHSHNSSCIYSVENQMGTLSSSSCQLRLGVDLSHLG